MSLLDFDDGLKELQQKEIEKRKIEFVKRLQGEGLNDYQIERKKEEEYLKPEKLKKFDAVKNTGINKVVFYFNDLDFETFKQHFTVLEYVETNSNSNWLLLGLIDLIEDGKIQYSEKDKEVWVI